MYVTLLLGPIFVAMALNRAVPALAELGSFVFLTDHPDDPAERVRYSIPLLWGLSFAVLALALTVPLFRIQTKYQRTGRKLTFAKFLTGETLRDDGLAPEGLRRSCLFMAILRFLASAGVFGVTHWFELSLAPFDDNFALAVQHGPWIYGLAMLVLARGVKLDDKAPT